MSRIGIIGWVISLAGTVLWFYGYFTTGNPPLINWQAHSPWWIADFLPNIQSEAGMLLACTGTILTYWPER